MDTRIVEFILYGNGGAATRWELRFNLRCAVNVRLTTSADKFEIVPLGAVDEPLVTRLMQVVDRSNGTTEVEAKCFRPREFCYQNLSANPDVTDLRITAEGQS